VTVGAEVPPEALTGHAVEVECGQCLQEYSPNGLSHVRARARLGVRPDIHRDTTQIAVEPNVIR
jgi:hypothetical protein